MGKRTEPWWICRTCGKKIAKVKSRKFLKEIDKHRKVCYRSAACSIKQIEQGK